MIRYFCIFLLLTISSSCSRSEKFVLFKIIKKAESKIITTDGSRDALILRKRWKGRVCNFELSNKTDSAISVKEIILFDVKHDLPYSTPLYGEGFTMSSQTGGTLGMPLQLGSHTDRDHYRMPEPEDTTVVYNMLKLKGPKGRYCLLAFSSSHRFVGRFYIKDDHILVGVDCEGLYLGPGESWKLEEFMCLEGEATSDLFSQLADRIDQNHPRLPIHEIPRGWGSWHCYGSQVTSEDINANVEIIKTLNLPFEYIQIDDGYQAAMGDWLSTHKNFGKPIEELISEIKQKGMEPAVWVAPFIAERESEVFKNHPGWFVKGKDGQPLRSDKVSFGGWRKGPWYVLDGTHPEVQNHLKDIFGVMKREWGCNYFKLDANFWGAIHGGEFYDKNATRVEAYRSGMEAILKATGDSFVLGSNHPLWPSLGLINSSRTSRDLVHNRKAYRNIAFGNLCRNWMNRTLWINDPDCLVLNRNQPYDETLFHTSIVYATGGLILSGDDLSTLPKEKIDLLEKLLSSSGEPFVFQNDALEVGVKDHSNSKELCLLNWSEKIKILRYKLDHQYEVRDKWTNMSLGVHDTMYVQKLLPNSGRILELIELQ